MVVGDVVSDVIDLAISASSNLQPAVGVSLLITSVAGDDTTSANFLMYDGTNTAIIIGDWSSVHTEVGALVSTVKTFLTNTNYMQIYNSSSSHSSVLAYSGIQV